MEEKPKQAEGKTPCRRATGSGLFPLKWAHTCSGQIGARTNVSWCYVSNQCQLLNPRQVGLPTIPLQIKVISSAPWGQWHPDSRFHSTETLCKVQPQEYDCHLQTALFPLPRASQSYFIVFFFFKSMQSPPSRHFQTTTAHYFIENYSPLRHPWLHGPLLHYQHLTSDFPETSLNLYSMRKLAKGQASRIGPIKEP